MPAQFYYLESLLDEFSNADGLDPNRRERLKESIRVEAEALGIEADLDINDECSHSDALSRIDRFVCDIKETQFGDGLHIFGRKCQQILPFKTECSELAEQQAIRNALSGKHISWSIWFTLSWADGCIALWTQFICY